MFSCTYNLILQTLLIKKDRPHRNLPVFPTLNEFESRFRILPRYSSNFTAARELSFLFSRRIPQRFRVTLFRLEKVLTTVVQKINLVDLQVLIKDHANLFCTAEQSFFQTILVTELLEKI